jgi:RNA polymerase sigma-70 factor (ECF subfamily)
MSDPLDLARQTLALHPSLSEVEIPTALVEQLGAAIDGAFAAWPRLEVEPSIWCRYLGARLPELSSLPRVLPRLRVEELYLCCACASGDPRAVTAFSERYLPVIDGALRKLRLGQGLREEVRQQLVMRLLVADGGSPPMIVNYAGTGRLENWLRVVTARTARKALEREKRVVLSEDDWLEEELVQRQGDAELTHIKQAYRQAFRDAFRQALASLKPREITLLRQRFVDGLTLEEIAAVYRVHHSTALRWLEKTRLSLLDLTMARLAERLKISQQDCSTIMRLIQSDIDLTLPTLLGSARGRR